MPRFVFLAVNAQPIYPSHAARLLKGCLPENGGWEWITIETALRDSPLTSLERVIPLNPDILGTTFYLFNREWLYAFLSRFRALVPRTVVIGGGPEWLGESRGFFEPFPLVHAGVRGEGEVAFRQWLKIWDEPGKWDSIQGLIWKDSGGVIHDDGREAIRPGEEEIPFLRREEDRTQNRPFAFLETMRGCSGGCLFCTSAGRGGVRFFSPRRVHDELVAIRDAGIREVRLLDRTFNEEEARACELLELCLQIHPDARYHLEIDPAKMTAGLAEVCRRFLPGRLHIEAGVQTLEEAARWASGRRGTAVEVWKGLNLLRSTGAELHLDLLAGLPEQSWEGLLADLTALSVWGPDTIQLEVVKVLPGTRLERQAAVRGVRYAPRPPYEVLETPTFSFSHLRRAMRLSRMVDWYYNERSLRPVVQRFSGEIPEFWTDFERFLSNRQIGGEGLSLERRYGLLYEWLGPGHGSQRAMLTDAWYRRNPMIHEGMAPARFCSPKMMAKMVREEGEGEDPFWRVIEVEGTPTRFYAWKIEEGGRRKLAAVFRANG